MVESGTAVSSDLALAEAKRNLELKRPQWLGDFAQVMGGVEIVRSAQFPLPVTLATKDVPLLCAAIAAKCQFFATGDKRDFGHLDGGTVQVISLVRLAQLLAERSRR